MCACKSRDKLNPRHLGAAVEWGHGGARPVCLLLNLAERESMVSRRRRQGSEPWLQPFLRRLTPHPEDTGPR